MKKKKIFGMFGLFLLGIYFICLGTSKAAPSSLTISLGGIMNYLTIQDSSGTNLGGAWSKVNSGNTVLYCMENNKVWPDDNMTYNLSSTADDKGLVYILENGYNGVNNKTIVDGGDKDRYITQAAIWLYIKGTLGSNFEEAADPEGLKPHMKRLAQEAREVRDGTRSYASTTSTSVVIDNVDTAMSLSSDKKSYVSKTITPTVTKATTYSVSASGADGVKVLGTNGSEKSTFNSGEGFVISVPAASVTNSSNINVSVSATGDVSYINVYTPATNTSDKNYQSILTVGTKNTTVTKNLVLTASHETVCVDYVIVGDVKPDPKLTDPTPEKKCYDKGTPYDQENKLTTKTNCTFKGWFTSDSLTGEWTNGTALNNDMTLYGAWDCPTVTVPPTAAGTPFIILGAGMVAISVGTIFYLVREKKNVKNNS